jgi:ABC-type amino acid transport substrate-binding protein/heat shock protein HslJ
MKSRFLKPLAILAIATFVLAACAPVGTPAPEDAVWARIQQNGKIVVGTSMDYPPYEFVNQQYVADGFDIALIGELSKQMGIPMDVKNYAFEGLGNDLETGDIDIAISAIAVTPEREESFSFSNVYLTDTSGALTLPTSTIVITAPEQLAAYRVGVQRGSAYETALQTLLVDTGLMPASRLYSFISSDDALVGLTRNQIDLYVLDQGTAQVFAETNNLRIAGSGTNPQRYAVEMAKGTPVLLENINNALLTLSNNGTIGRLAKEYLGYDASALPSTCVDGMSYVADVTYDDKNMTAPPQVTPGQSFIKTWRVKNTGTCSWISGYQLVYAYGNTAASSMGGKPVPITTPVAPGTTTDLSAALTAPTTPGTYQGFWQMVNDKGTPFGQTIWVGVTVVDTSKPTPAPIPAPSITSFSVTPGTITLGQCVTASWVVQGNVTNVVFERDGTDLWKGAPASGQTQDCPPKAGKVVYALGAYGPGGQDLEKVTVTVNQPASPPTSTPVPPVNPLVGPTWELITLDNASVDTALGVNLIFQSNGSVQGFDGCANFSATYQSSGGQLSFSDLPSGTGVSNCLPDAQTVSTAYLTALSEITNFSISGNTLTLKDADGAQRLQYNK